MSTPVEFDPRLCETPEKRLDLTQRNLILAFLPYLGAPLSGSDVSEDAFKLIEAAFGSLQKPLGRWELVWGPGVFQVVPGAIPANTMFVAENQETGELFISIAGTNPFSAYAWFVEDFNVSETRAWNYGDAPESVALSKGTLKGLLALQGMVPPTGIPGANTSLANFLATRFSQEGGPVDVTVSGHSLGGALSPTLALWLLDTQKEWDHHARATISVYAYAGPSPGNDDFAAYIDARFGDRLQRITNPLDAVTHAWNVGDLADLKPLYTPELSRNAYWDKAVDFLIAATNGIHYRQIDRSPVRLEGKLNEELVWKFAPSLVNYAAQVLYQHTLAYFDLLGIAYPEERSRLGRHLSHQTNDAVRGILSRAGFPPLLAGAIGAGLRLVSEAWSRTPLVPSPVPGGEAAEA
jgi:hypothetical protein